MSEMQKFENLFRSYKLSNEMNNLIESCEYDFGEESDLFKAPEPIIEEPMLSIDPLSQELVEFSDDQQLIIDKAFYECEQDLIVKSAMESPLSAVIDIKDISLVAKLDNVMKTTSSEIISDVPMSKSASSGNLSSMAHHEDVVIQSFLDFPPVDYEMRRAFSESDIQTMGAQTKLDQIIVSCIDEDRREKLSRYRKKKSRRNFKRKIKYACRKALADSQPRIRGRFAKNRGDA